jgi:hypothetical protein
VLRLCAKCHGELELDIDYILEWLCPTVSLAPFPNSQSVDVIVVPRHLVEVRFVPGLFMRHSHQRLDSLSVEPTAYT